jgi:hypothetical protein
MSDRLMLMFRLFPRRTLPILVGFSWAVRQYSEVLSADPILRRQHGWNLGKRIREAIGGAFSDVDEILLS